MRGAGDQGGRRTPSTLNHSAASGTRGTVVPGVRFLQASSAGLAGWVADPRFILTLESAVVHQAAVGPLSNHGDKSAVIHIHDEKARRCKGSIW